MMRTAGMILLFLMLGCSPKQPVQQSVPLPVPEKPLTLRVVYAHNPRFKRLTADDLAALLSYTKTACKNHLGIHVTFDVAPSIGIDALFGYLKPEVRRARIGEIYDFRRGGDRKRLVAAMLKGLKERHTPLADMIAYAAPFLPLPPKQQTYEALAEALTDTLIQRITLWERMKTSDGTPVIDASSYNEWTFWDSLGYGALPYDIVITNTLIASVEYYGQDIHSALRGGLTVGTTTNNKSELGAYVFWSTFPFTEEYPLLKSLRDKEYAQDDALMLSGTYLAHEIGHLLFHYGHTFETGNCIMTPVPMLRFKAWHDRLDPQKCREGNYPGMQKGAATIYYNPEW